jgi:nucleoid-associated protein YgaU
MPLSRYARAPILDFGAQQGTSNAAAIIRSAIKSGNVSTKTVITRGRDRLDTLAGELYGDARYWWVLAAASDIGWGMQIQPGTIILVPDLSSISAIIG